MQATTFTFYVYPKQTLTTKGTGLFCLPQCSRHLIFSTKTYFRCVLAFPGFLLVCLCLFVLGFCLGFAFVCICVRVFYLFVFRKFDWDFLLLIVFGFSLVILERTPVQPGLLKHMKNSGARSLKAPMKLERLNQI